MAGILRVDQANVDYIYAKTVGVKTYIPGHVIQVVHGEDSTTYTTTSTSSWTTICSAIITPTNVNSKILIIASAGEPDISDGRLMCAVFRNTTSTQVLRVTTEMGRGISNTAETHYPPLTKQGIDTPATTSAITYFMGIMCGVAGTGRVGNGSRHQLTLMEIAQ